MNRRIILFGSAVLVGALSIQMRTSPKKEGTINPHLRGGLLDSLFQGTNEHFASAGLCDHCHGADPAGIASVDGEGSDINVVDDWSSTMMANSARDPFWRAKVSHEVLINPAHQEEIESTCTRCHAPLGNYNAQAEGQLHYSIAEMTEDTVALDGVSCLACHQQLPQPETAQHTGTLFFDDNPMVYGPYTSPLVTPMALASGYIPEHGAHINDSKLCAGCHSLVTNTADLEGNLTGDEFVEQATWHEWLNSSYDEMGTTCQSCHLPQVDNPGVILAAGFDTEPRSPFGLHTLAGGNTLMLSIMRDYREELGIYASEVQFNETISKTLNNLQQQSVVLETTTQERTEDTVFIDVKLRNITGHKLPSGYPARRMSVRLLVTDADGNEIFHSGSFTPDHYIVGEDEIEPHHNLITSEDEVQIYEMVMGDVEGNETTVLERAYSHLKDNRLVPLGFSASHPVYDTTAIVLGIPDPDFNYDPAEGSGTDVIHYHIPLNGFTGALNVEVAVYYQSIPPVWLEEIFESTTPEIESFESMYAAADKTPVQMRETSFSVPAFVGVNELNELGWQVRANGNMWTMNVPGSGSAEIFDLSGKRIATQTLIEGINTFYLTLSTGTYYVIYTPRSGKSDVQKVLVRQ